MLQVPVLGSRGGRLVALRGMTPIRARGDILLSVIFHAFLLFRARDLISVKTILHSSVQMGCKLTIRLSIHFGVQSYKGPVRIS